MKPDTMRNVGERFASHETVTHSDDVRYGASSARVKPEG